MNEPNRPGRNDPCWCGSGKKYKNCHWNADEQEAIAKALSTNLLMQLQEYALQLRFDRDLQAAREFFYGPDFEPPDDDEDETFLAAERALDYFIYDYRLGDDRRVIGQFAAEYSKRLRPDERYLLANWQHSRLAAYEVLTVTPGVGLRLRDLVSGEEFDVRAPEAAEHVNQWNVLFTRVLPAGNHYRLGGMGLYIPPRFRDWLRGYAQDLWSEYRLRHEGESYEDFLHASSQLINQFILNEIEPVMNQLPTLVNAEGDLVEMCQAAYDVVDYPLALAALREAEEFDEVSEENEPEKEFTWREAGESLDLLREYGPEFEYHQATGVEQGGVRILGRVALGETELELETQSERRLAAGKELLEKRLGSAIQFVEDIIQPLEDVLAELPDSDEESDEEPELSEELEEFAAEAMAKEKHGWIEREVPALDGKTPREAVKTLAGRIRVIRLLKEFESLESHRARAGEISYSWDEVKQELGLDQAEFLTESKLEDQLVEELEEIEDLAHKDRPEEGLACWHALRDRYRIAGVGDFDFAEVWDLYEIYDEALIELVDRLASAKQCEQGIALTQELAAFDPDEQERWRAEEAQLRVEHGETETGLAILRELVEQSPEQWNGIMILADVQWNMLGQPDEAIATLQRGLAAIDDDLILEDLEGQIVEIYLETGRPDKAEQFWHAQNDQGEPSDAEYRDLILILLHRGDFAAARETAEQMTGEYARPYWTGMVEATTGNYDRAREAWANDLTKPEFDDWFAWHQWTELHLRLHDANPILKNISQDRPGLPAYGKFYLALAYALKGDLKQAGKIAADAHQALKRERRPMQWPSIQRDLHQLAVEIRLSPEAITALGL